MTKTPRIVAIVVCMLILVLPCLAIPFFRPVDGIQENRYLADFPRVVDETDGLNPNYDSEFESWLCDHFAFRTQAVRANALINYRLLNTSANDSVIAGKEGWLYFADTVPDYTGEGLLSAQELSRIEDNLGQLAGALSRHGAKLYIAIVPNKNTVYPAFMPRRYDMRRHEGNIDLLKSVCERLPVTWIDLEATMKGAAADDPLVYCRTDTHWNALGAAIAARAVLDALGKGGADFSVSGEASFSGGDLARLMGAPDDLTEQVPVVIPSTTLPEDDFSRHHMRCAGDGNGTLLVYRDSFGTAVGPWIVQACGDTILEWSNPLDGSIDCDDALLLICERNLREYLLEPPYLEDEPQEDDAEPDGDSFVPIDPDDDFFDDGEETTNASPGRVKDGI